VKTYCWQSHDRGKRRGDECYGNRVRESTIHIAATKSEAANNEPSENQPAQRNAYQARHKPIPCFLILPHRVNLYSQPVLH